MFRLSDPSPRQKLIAQELIHHADEIEIESKFGVGAVRADAGTEQKVFDNNHR